MEIWQQRHENLRRKRTESAAPLRRARFRTTANAESRCTRIRMSFRRRPRGRVSDRD